MRPCDDRIEALVEAAADDLAREPRAALEAHLAACAGCRAEFRSLRDTESLLRTTSRVPDEFSLSGFAYRAADRAEAFRDRSARGVWWSFTRGARLAMTFSATAFAASLALFVAARTPPAALPVQVAVATAGDTNADWEEYIPDAISLVHDEGPEIGDTDEDQTASLDYGLESLSADELDSLSKELDQTTG